MTKDQLIELFSKYGDAWQECEEVARQHQTTTRRDLCAFNLLDKLLPHEPTYKGSAPDMVCAAEHDQIWLDVDLEKLAEVVTEDQVKALSGFGVFLESDTESLSMFA